MDGSLEDLPGHPFERGPQRVGLPSVVDLDLAGLALVANCGGQLVGQSHPPIDRFEQQSAPVGGLRGLVELNEDGLLEEVLEGNGVFGVVGHRAALARERFPSESGRCYEVAARSVTTQRE
jgi:hypothetical protein